MVDFKGDTTPNINDFPAAFFISALSHAAISTISSETGKDLSPRVQRGASVFIGAAFAIAAETFIPMSTSELPDIPAGIAGSLAYLGAVQFGSWAWDRFQSRKMNLNSNSLKM